MNRLLYLFSLNNNIDNNNNNNNDYNNNNYYYYYYYYYLKVSSAVVVISDLALSLSQAMIHVIGFCKQRKNEPSPLDLRCLTFSLSILHINFFPIESLLKTKPKQTTNVVWRRKT